MNCKVCSSQRTFKEFDAFNRHGRYTLDSSDVFEILRCGDCGAIFVSNIKIDTDYYKKYYENDYYTQSFVPCFLKVPLFFLTKLYFNSVERLLLKYIKNKGVFPFRLLDFGCGKGEFLEHIDSSRFEKYGIEINKEGYETCIRKGIKVYNQDIDALSFLNGYFDIVTLWHVVEHIEDPDRILTGMHRSLKRGGILVLATPNSRSLGFRWGKNLWFHLDTPRHLVIYDKANINLLLKKAGFEFVAQENTFYDYPLDLFWSLKNSCWKWIVYPLYPFFKLFSNEILVLVFRKC